MTDDQLLFRSCIDLLHDGARALRIGLLGGKAVAAINLHEKLGHTQSLHNGPQRMDRFFGAPGQGRKSPAEWNGIEWKPGFYYFRRTPSINDWRTRNQGRAELPERLIL